MTLARERFSLAAGIPPVRASPAAQDPTPRKACSVYSRLLFFLFLSRDPSQAAEERGSPNGNILFSHREKGKWEKRKQDKANRKFAPNEEQPFSEEL